MQNVWAKDRNMKCGLCFMNGEKKRRNKSNWFPVQEKLARGRKCHAKLPIIDGIRQKQNALRMELSAEGPLQASVGTPCSVVREHTIVGPTTHERRRKSRQGLD